MTSKKKDLFLVLGSGGHAKVLLDAMLQMNLSPINLLSSDETQWGKHLFNIPIIGDDTYFSLNPTDSDLNFIIGFGNQKHWINRHKLFLDFSERMMPFNIIHPSSIVSPFSSIDNGTAVLARAVINPNVTVGKNSVINTGAIIEHDCIIGNNVHIAPGAVLCGGVTIEDHAFIGANSVICNQIEIKTGTVIGAGSVVTSDITANTMVAGNPACFIKSLQ
ncbi:MAG: acetyltransferase [Methylocystaceae bacterium]|nr:acetyltransferase [Methylocystaceae bacterium]